MRMTPQAAQAWQSFVAGVRRDAPADVDADDLADSLQAHLESRAEPLVELDGAAMQRIIDEVRGDLLEEFKASETEGGSQDPDWWNLGAFFVALSLSPFVGPLPLAASWIYSRYRMTRAHHPLDALPSAFGAAILIAGLPIMLGYTIVSIGTELVRAPVGAYAAATAALSLAGFTVLIGLRPWRPALFRKIFAPLDAVVGERLGRWLAISGGIAALAAAALAGLATVL
jgi:hypothetical protein